MRRLLRLLMVGLGTMVMAHAAPAPRLLLLDSAEGTTARALKALAVPCTVAGVGDLATGKQSPFAYQIVMVGMDVDRAGLSASAERLLAFVRAGGVFLAMRGQAEDEWLPGTPKMDKAYELGQILQPEHPLFAQFSRADLTQVHAGSIYRAFHALGAGWVPLVSAGAEQNWDKTPAASTGPHYGLIELPLAQGRIILCQMIPEYGFMNDDKGQPGASSRLLQSLVAYVTSVAPHWPAPRPRVVPASYHTDLSLLLRDTGARGTLPMADRAWRVTSRGAYICKPDRRGVMTVSAAARPAVAGSFLQLERDIKVAPGQTFVRFYSSDDYCGGMDPHMVGDRRESQRENRVKDTRFKQVLVNGKVVWEQDVLGLNERPASRRFHTVDLSAAAGKTGAFTLALRVEDRQPTAEDEPFATDVYWAGVDVLPGIVQLPVEEKQTTVKTVFSGPPGRYSVVVRVLDEHTGRGRLTATVDGKPLGSEQLTADDYGWYWVTLGFANLKPASVIVIKATPEGGESCRMQSLAFVPLSVRERVPGAETTRQQELFRAAVSSTLVASPLFKPGAAVTRATFPVVVSGPEGYQPHGEIVSGGMPFAYGAVKTEGNLRLLNDQGKEVPLQTRVLAQWPDGSLKWVLFTFPTGPGALRCEYGTQVRREPVKGVTVTQTDRAVSIDTGPLQVTISKKSGKLCDTVRLKGKTLRENHRTGWDLTLWAGEKHYSSSGNTVTRCQLVEAGPLRAIVRRVGRLTAEDGTTLLEYDLTQEFYVNSGVTRVQPVLTHQESSAEERLRLASCVVFLDPKKPEGLAAWANVDGQWVKGEYAAVKQTDDQHSVASVRSVSGGQLQSVGDDTGRKNGFARIIADDVSMDFIPRWFWQMYPRFYQAYMGEYTISLLSEQGRDNPFVLHQGQAIWNDFALRFTTETGQPHTADFEALANPAVALAAPHHVAATLALWQFAPQNKTLLPEYEEGVERCYQGYMAKREARREYGLENFGDDTFEWGYGPSYTFWSNQEYDHHYGMLLQFLRSGDWRWWEIGDEGARHNVNEDCYHWAPGREHLIGSPHHHNARHIVDKGWVADHTVSGSHVSHAWVEGLIAYYYLTGDPRTLETWNAMGDWFVWCVNNNQYGAGGQERGPGWTLVALSALYNATHDRKYLEAGNKVMDWLWDIQDPVRGVISVPVSEQPSYEGGSSFMHGIVARGAGRWYEATGDVRGKLAAIGIADWLTAEAMGPPAGFYYKQAPRVKGGYGSDWQCLTAMSYALQYGDAGWYGPLAETLYGSGRPDIRSMAWAPQSLAHLLPRFTPYRARLLTPQITAAPDQPGQLRLQLANSGARPVTVATTVVSAPAGAAIPQPLPVIIPAHGQAELLVSVGIKHVATGSGVVQLRLSSGSEGRLYEARVAAMARVVRIEKTAAEGQLQAPFVLDRDQTATAPREASFTGNPRQPGERVGWVEWTVDLPAAGSYLLTADCWWRDDKGNSLYLQVDDGPEVVFGNDGDMGRWHVVRAPELLRLETGRHVIRLLNREDGAKMRRVVLEATELR
jgi:hypothetical protein